MAFDQQVGSLGRETTNIISEALDDRSEYDAGGTREGRPGEARGIDRRARNVVENAVRPNAAKPALQRSLLGGNALQPRRCGTPFCLGAWEQTSPAIDTWAALASERSSLNCSASSELYQFFDQAIAAHSSQYPQLYTAKLKALVLSKNWDQALSFSDKVSQSTSTLEPEFYYWQAEAQLKATRPNDALINFVRFVELQPNSRLAPLALFMTGLVSLNLQKKVEAKQYFQQTIQNYPNSPEATRAKAFLAAL